ncbi:MAG: hypothetical protein JNJ49_09110 [Bdellovibrionaceae bacterium]|nr:hypothetical protein [Pseudobdellovibrionaceae bacterium]
MSKVIHALAFSVMPFCLFVLPPDAALAAELQPKCQAAAQVYADNVTGKVGTALQLADVYEVDLNEGGALVQVELYVNQSEKLFIFTTNGARFNYVRDARGNYVPVPNPGLGCTVDKF